jgi:hypothetical protein
MLCDQVRLQLQEQLDRGEKPGEALRTHIRICEACRAYAFWLELGIHGMEMLPAVSPRREVFREISRQLAREQILRPWYSPARIAGVVALGTAGAAAGLLAAVHPRVPHGFVEGLTGRAMWIARPVWAALNELCGRLVPFGAALGHAAEPFVSRLVGLPWVEALLLSLVGATATGMMMLLSMRWDKRRLGHALAL